MQVPIEIVLVLVVGCSYLGYQLIKYFNNLKKGKCGCSKCGGK